MLRYSKVINEETKQCEVADYETYTEKQINYFESLGMTLQDVDKAYNEIWYLMGYVPQQPIDEQNESIRQARLSLYRENTDELTLRKLRKQALGTWTRQDEEEYLSEIKKMSDDIKVNNPYL